MIFSKPGSILGQAITLHQDLLFDYVLCRVDELFGNLHVVRDGVPEDVPNPIFHLFQRAAALLGGVHKAFEINESGKTKYF